MDPLEIEIAKKRIIQDVLPKDKIGPIPTSTIPYVLLSLIAPKKARYEQNKITTYLEKRLDRLSEHNILESVYRHALRIIYNGRNPRHVLKKISDFSFEMTKYELTKKGNPPENPFT